MGVSRKMRLFLQLGKLEHAVWDLLPSLTCLLKKISYLINKIISGKSPKVKCFISHGKRGLWAA